MRFPFPPPETLAASPAAAVEPQKLELDIPPSDRTISHATGSVVDNSSACPAATSLPVTPDFATTENPPKPTAISVEVKTPHFVPESASIPAAFAEASPAPLVETPPQLEELVKPRPKPKRKVIAFPRVPKAAETTPRLADPVLEQPRILDVPEELEAYPTTPFLEGLQFDSATQVSLSQAEQITLPFRPASLFHRICGALVDCSLVLVAAVVFGFVAHKMAPNLVLTKPVRVIAGMVSMLFWIIFQYLLLVYAGKTAGMQAARLRLKTFNGRMPSLRHRRNRVLGLYLSTASLVMGLLWAFVDVDTLCWHDRMSGTYLTRQE